MAKLLIVDDDPALLDALPEAIRFRMPDADIDTAASTREAACRLLTGSYDAILTDMVMPGMLAGSYLSSLKRLALDTPVIVMTGMPEDQCPEVAMSLFGVLTKPFDVDRLVALTQIAVGEVEPALQS
jgi:DNA-binding NtrC family response regulator